MHSTTNLNISTEELLKILRAKLEQNNLSEKEIYEIKLSIAFLTSVKKPS